MKRLFIAVLAISLIACSKSSENIVEKPKKEAISSTYWLHIYDDNNTYVETILSFHECSIDDPMIIAQRRSAPALEPICYNNNILELKISEPCKVPCPLKRN